MKKLSEKKYWEKLYDLNGFNNYSKFKSKIAYSLQNYEYFKIIKKYTHNKYKNIIEIGCAPGGFLIKAHNKLKLKPFGVDYTLNGKLITEKNMKANKITEFEIFYSDVFSTKFQKEKKEKFDIVMSNGFAEHFEDLKKVINSHANLTKVGGIIVISIPNLLYFNKYLTIKEVKNICNLDVMNLKTIKQNIPSNIAIKELKYYGGLFNIGVFFFNNKILEKIRLAIFIGQRLIFDPIGILLSKLGIDLNWKYSSPAIILIGKKIK